MTFSLATSTGHKRSSQRQRDLLAQCVFPSPRQWTPWSCKPRGNIYVCAFARLSVIKSKPSVIRAMNFVSLHVSFLKECGICEGLLAVVQMLFLSAFLFFPQLFFALRIRIVYWLLLCRYFCFSVSFFFISILRIRGTSHTAAFVFHFHVKPLVTSTFFFYEAPCEAACYFDIFHSRPLWLPQ